MAHDVFISYSTKDKVIADTIVAALENNQIRCWYAPRDIKPSEDWGKAITAAIKKSKVFLMIFSSYANHSQRVLDELNYAITQQAVILPFRVENLEPDDAMGLHLASRHWLDAYEPSWHNHIKNLVKAVSGNLETALKEDQISLPANLEKSIKQQRPGWSKILIGGIVGAIIIGSGWYGWSLLNKRGEGDQAASAREESIEIEDTSTPGIMATNTSTALPEPTLEPTLPDSSTELGTPDYETDFSPDNLELDVWPIGERDADGNVYVSTNGELIVENFDALLYSGSKNFTNSIIEVDAKFESMDSYENEMILLCRNTYLPGKSGHNGYRAHFSSTGEVYIDASDIGTITTIGSGKVDSFQKDKFYRLRFDCEGTQFRVYVNGMIVVSGNNSTFYSGNMGLSSENSSVAFDNFKLWFP